MKPEKAIAQTSTQRMVTPFPEGAQILAWQSSQKNGAFVTNLAQKPAHQGTLNKILYSSDSVNYPLYLPNQYPKFVKIYRPDGGFIKCN